MPKNRCFFVRNWLTDIVVDTNLMMKCHLDKQKKGKIKVNLNNRTSRENVFAGGDVSGTKSTIAWTAKSGRTAAIDVKFTIIYKYLFTFSLYKY